MYLDVALYVFVPFLFFVIAPLTQVGLTEFSVLEPVARRLHGLNVELIALSSASPGPLCTLSSQQVKD